MSASQPPTWLPTQVEVSEGDVANPGLGAADSAVWGPNQLPSPSTQPTQGCQQRIPLSVARTSQPGAR